MNNFYPYKQKSIKKCFQRLQIYTTSLWLRQICVVKAQMVLGCSEMCCVER